MSQQSNLATELVHLLISGREDNFLRMLRMTEMVGQSESHRSSQGARRDPYHVAIRLTTPYKLASPLPATRV